MEIALGARLANQDLMSAGLSPQAPSLFGSAVDPNSNGFDFGMSQPKRGLGYGLLSGRNWPADNQGCTDCPPDDPCPSCSDGADADVQGQIIKTQAPVMPMPGWLPPPPTGLPQQPSGNVVIGRPNDWWNWTPGEVGDWIKGWVHAQPSDDVEEMCWEQYQLDTINCNLKKAYAGAAAARACHEQAAAAYADCRKKGEKSDIPRFDRN